jgi:hypothetical protein
VSGAPFLRSSQLIQISFAQTILVYGMFRELSLMSAEGRAFLESWIDQNVTYLDKGGDYIRALMLADRCILDAAAEGITITDLEPNGRVEKIIYAALRFDSKNLSGENAIQSDPEESGEGNRDERQ